MNIFCLSFVILTLLYTVKSSKYSYVSSLIKITPIEGKGYGLISIAPISKGTLLIEEECLFQLKTLQIRMTEESEIERVDKQVNSLNGIEKQQFLSLHGYTKSIHKKNIDIFRTNAYPTTKQTAGIFPFISRINSECNPNVHYSFNEETNRATIYAIKDIESNSEILNSYIGLFLSFKERQEYLLKHFGYICNCQVCKKNETEREMSDKRRISLMDMDNEMKYLLQNETYDSQHAMKLVRKTLKLLEQEEINCPSTLYKVEEIAFNITKDMYWYNRYINNLSLCKGSTKIV